MTCIFPEVTVEVIVVVDVRVHVAVIGFCFGCCTGETAGQIAVTEIRQSGSPLEFATLPVAEIIP